MRVWRISCHHLQAWTGAHCGGLDPPTACFNLSQYPPAFHFYNASRRKTQYILQSFWSIASKDIHILCLALFDRLSVQLHDSVAVSKNPNVSDVYRCQVAKSFDFFLNRNCTTPMGSQRSPDRDGTGSEPFDLWPDPTRPKSLTRGPKTWFQHCLRPSSWWIGGCCPSSRTEPRSRPSALQSCL